MALKHSDIAEQVGINLSYVGFAYGGPLNRAALSGEIDVLLTADQPALALLSRDSGFRIVARMMYNRVCIYVPPQSPVNGLAALTGRRVSGPVGAAAERVALSSIQSAGVDLASVRLGNLDMAQQTALLRRSDNRSAWTGVDALYGFDPLPAVFEDQGLARMLHCGHVVAVVIASNEMMTRRRAELVQFLQAFALSWALFAREPAQLNARFSEESRLGVSQGVLNTAASVEPNYSAKAFSDIRLTFSPEDLDMFADVVRFLHTRDIVTKDLSVDTFIDLAPLREALADPALVDRAARIRLR
jgi:ABC-type nitrate/sulfonate/bicarbonate transport system substrate-binding protein